MRAVWALFFFLVVAKASAYWVGSLMQRPNDPFSTIVIYRGKDIESYPILKNLAHLGFGEPGLFEGHNKGVLGDRFVPWVPHAILFRLAGAAGFVLGDLLLTPLRFLLLAILLRRCGIAPVPSIAASALLTCSAINDFGQVFPGIPGLTFWGLRLPRPFISEFFLLLAMIGALGALNRLRETGQASLWNWAVAGAGIALLFQSDFYSATGLGLAFMAVLISTLVAMPKDWKALLRGSVVSLAVAVLFSVPGIVQSLLVNPEGMIRLGLFPVSRLAPPYINVPQWYAALAGLIALHWLMGRNAAGRSGESSVQQRSGRMFFLVTCAAALVAMPLTSVVLGKAIEIYHYRDSFTRYLSMALVVMGLQLLEAAWRFLAIRIRESKPSFNFDKVRESNVLAWLVACPAALLCVLFAWQFATANPTRATHMRGEFPEWAALPDYRAAFVELARELSQTKYDAYPVMGTFDHQVWSWWVTFRDKYSYLADACTTNVSADELERRAAELARYVGMDRKEFESFAHRRYVMIFWMSCAKYQASQAYSYSPLSDYTEDDRRRIQSTPNYLNFTVALPLSQQVRLGNLFESLDMKQMRRLDVIVLTRDESVQTFVPPSSEFELTFENRLFRVWVRRRAAPSA